MTYTEILELIRAGYTKSEIDAMMTNDNPEPTPEPEKKKPEPDEQKGNPTEPDPQKDNPPESEAVKLAKALGLKLDSMLTAIQSANIANAEQSGNTMTADDVIASIINPK